MSVPLPSISVVVPNLNGGRSLRRTLASLIEQGYPGLEIVVADGGSSDDSLRILRELEPHLAAWFSGPDAGQTDAINKGLERCQGEIVNWLSSDDVLAPGALRRVGEAFSRAPGADVVVGRVLLDDRVAGTRRLLPAATQARIDLLPLANYVPQQACFYRRALLRRVPPLDPALSYAMDTELWCYFRALGARWEPIPDVLATFTLDGHNKTSQAGRKAALERELIYRRYTDERIPLAWWYRQLHLPVCLWRGRWPTPGRRACAIASKAAFVAALGPFYGYQRAFHMDLGV